MKYLLVLAAGKDISCVRYERFRDGSALAVADAAYVRAKGLDATRYRGGIVINADEDDAAWLRLWNELSGAAYLEASEARERGVLPADWVEPPAPTGLRW